MKHQFFRNLPLLAILFGSLMVHADDMAVTEIGPSEKEPVPWAVKPESHQVKKLPFYEYHNRMVVFDPFFIAYERIKPHSFYAGVEGWSTIALVWGNYNMDFFPLGQIADVEARLGYNFFYNGRDHVTPFIGGGVFKDWTKETHDSTTIDRGDFIEHSYKESFLPAVGYATMGFLYDHEFTSVFNLGFNAKALLGSPIQTKYWGPSVVGFDVSMPLTFRFGYKRHWDFRVEPFDIYLQSQYVTRNYFGLHTTVAYRF